MKLFVEGDIVYEIEEALCLQIQTELKKLPLKLKSNSPEQKSLKLRSQDHKFLSMSCFEFLKDCAV